MVDAIERVLLFRFLRVRLHDADAGEVLLRARRDLAKLILHRAVALTYALPDDDEQDCNQRHHGERVERQPRVDAHHRDGCDREGDDGVAEIRDTRPGHHADRREVIGGARHQIADLTLLEVVEIEALELPEKIRAHLIFGEARDAQHDEARAERDDPGDQRQADDHQRVTSQRADVNTLLYVVDRLADEEGRDERKQVRADQQEETRDQREEVATKIRPDTA